MALSKTGCSRSITKRDLDAMYYQGFAEGIKNVTDNIINDIEFTLTFATEEQKTGIEIALNIIKSHIPLN